MPASDRIADSSPGGSIPVTDSSNHEVEPSPEGRFPDPVLPPPEVDAVRQQRLHDVRRLVVVGVLVRGSVVVLELLGYWWLGSSALLADAIASLVDIASSLALLAAVHMAVRPPDDDHPFGHGRYEPLAGLQIGLLITAAGAVLLAQLVVGAQREVFLPRTGAYLIPLVATLALFSTSLVMRRIARRHRSGALAAESHHYLIDAATSVVATLALAVGEVAPGSAVATDRVAAVLLALMMLAVGLLAARENLHQLMDRTPEEPLFDRVREAASRVDGVEEVEKIRIQAAGPDAHVDVDIEVDPSMSVEESHRLAQQVRAAVQERWPMVREVVVHVEPYYEGDH